MAPKPKIDWETVFYRFASQPAPDRNYAKLAQTLGVAESTVFRERKRSNWDARMADLDAAARARRDQNAIRRLAERLDDDVRIVEAARMRYAQRLRDPAYQITGQEFFALARLELLIEGRDTAKIGIGSVSDDFMETLRRLPVYVRERIVLAHMTGRPIEEVMQLEQGYVDVGDDEGPEP